ncbi:MAG: hypothetical protein ACRD4Y_02395 [Candidatus Acidiferrales bacterium]
MKTLWRVLGVVVFSLAVALFILRITGLNPHGRIPGLWLTGQLVATPVTDWSFLDKVPNIKIQTEPWYLLPHSVTIDCLDYKGQFYVSSVYPAGTWKGWNENAMRDPHVRIKIGNKLYDRKLVLVTDPAEREALLQVRARKYPELKIPPNSTIHVFHVVG